jgi:hypothetical protein
MRSPVTALLAVVVVTGCAGTSRSVAPDDRTSQDMSLWIPAADAEGIPPVEEPWLRGLPTPGPEWVLVATSAGTGGDRTAGDRVIRLPHDVVRAIARKKIGTFPILVEVHVDEAGVPREARVVEPGGAPARVQELYDRTIRSWRYEPFVLRGKALRTVRSVLFLYHVG